MFRLSHNAKDIAARLLRAPRPVRESVDAELSRGAQMIARDAKISAPKATSQFTNSIHVKRLDELIYDIIAGTDYALSVEKGAGPGGMPPIESIEDWMRAKGIDGDAFLISRSIATRGTPAQPTMEPALDSNQSRINQRVRAALVEGLGRV